MRRILVSIFISAFVTAFGLLTAVAIGVLAWIPTAWPGYARDDRTQSLVILAILMACLAAAAFILRLRRPA